MTTKLPSRTEKQQGAGQARVAPFFVLRRPLRHAAAALFGGTENLVLPSDAGELHKRLEGDAFVLGALYLSSPTLYEATMRWLRLPANDAGAPPEALTRYLLRALNRPTPFGLFGLLSVGAVGADTAVSPIVDPQELRLMHRRSFAARSAELAQRAVQSYTPNPTLFRKGQEFRAWSCLNDEAEHCAIVSCQVDAVTDELFAPTNSGPIPAADVLARDLVDLVDAGLLVPQLPQPSVFHEWNGDNAAMTRVAGDLNSLPVNHPDRAVRYQAFDAAAHGGTRTPTKSSIYACGFTCPRLHERPRMSAATARRVAETAARLVEYFGRPNPALLQLQPAFSERYTYEATPLLHVLDSDLGDQFAQLLQAGASASIAAASEFDRFLLKHIARALEAGQREVKLRWTDIGHRAPRTTSQADLLVCPLFSLVTDPCSPERELTLWQGMEVRTGTALISRFEGLDETLADAASRWRSENADVHDDDAVLAEVVYVPYPRHGDVLQRPALTSHAIYLRGAAPEGGPQAIALQTLHLRLRNGSFELWCSSLGRRVRPILSVPHYFQGSQHPVYRFLCALAEQEVAVARLPLPTAVTDLPTCPRIVVDGVVLRAATWNVHLPPGAPERSDISALRALLASLGVPQKFGWGELDQVLPIDSSNDLHLQAFVDDLGPQHNVRLTEVFPPLTSVGPHEFVLPVRVSPEGTRKRAIGPALPIAQAPVRVALADEFVYLQLFASARQVDRLPLKLDGRLGHWLASRGLSWFYIKYSHPSAHLRLRVAVPAGVSRWELIRKLCERARALREDGLIDSFALAEFEPEVDRYGGPERWRWSARYFAADTDFALRVQRWVEEEGVDEDHLLMAMTLSALHVGLDFGLSTIELADVPVLPANGADLQVARQSAGALFRRFRPSIDQLCRGLPVESRHLRLIQEACEQRSGQTLADRRALLASLDQHERAAWAHWLYRCHAHMSINRLRPAHLGTAEQVALSLAARIAASRQARQSS
jgi:thiopeptide-type bacteriocin biosynthesis protein